MHGSLPALLRRKPLQLQRLLHLRGRQVYNGQDREPLFLLWLINRDPERQFGAHIQNQTRKLLMLVSVLRFGVLWKGRYIFGDGGYLW